MVTNLPSVTNVFVEAWWSTDLMSSLHHSVKPTAFSEVVFVDMLTVSVRTSLPHQKVHHCLNHLLYCVDLSKLIS